MTDKVSGKESAARRAEALRANLRRRKAATRKAKAPPPNAAREPN